MSLTDELDLHDLPQDDPEHHFSRAREDEPCVPEHGDDLELRPVSTRAAGERTAKLGSSTLLLAASAEQASRETSVRSRLEHIYIRYRTLEPFQRFALSRARVSIHVGSLQDTFFREECSLSRHQTLVHRKPNSNEESSE